MQTILCSTYHYRHVLPPQDPSCINWALQVLLRACDAVGFAHSRGVIHCDLKPSNIMVGSYGQVYVMDWGVSLSQNDEGQWCGSELMDFGTTPTDAYTKVPMSGTVAFMAPEQACADMTSIGVATDVFGLGAVLYAILTCKSPYGEQPDPVALLRSGKTDYVSPQQLRPTWDLPSRLCQIVARAMHHDPKSRYPDVSSFRLEVEKYVLGQARFPIETYVEGEMIIREGGEGNAAYIISSGKCEVLKDVGGKQVVVTELDIGGVFGEAAVFARKMRTATVRAKTNVSVLKVTRTSLEREISKTPWLRAFIRAMARRFTEVSKRLTRLTHERERYDMLRDVSIFMHQEQVERISTNLCVAKWSSLGVYLTNKFGRTTAEVVRMLSDSGEIKIDVVADKITWQVPVLRINRS